MDDGDGRGTGVAAPFPKMGLRHACATANEFQAVAKQPQPEGFRPRSGSAPLRTNSTVRLAEGNVNTVPGRKSTQITRAVFRDRRTNSTWLWPDPAGQ